MSSFYGECLLAFSITFTSACKKASMPNNNQNLTQGPVGFKLLLFTLPLLGGTLIQQLYNTVDLVFVGRLVGRGGGGGRRRHSFGELLDRVFYRLKRRLKRDNRQIFWG
ncbi:MAG: MatE [Deltaproteobacteria bacterium]|nr:MatE [Deltaproteobacteria bacterium]